MLDITTLAAWGEFIGGIAVVASLIYLAGQIRQNTRTVRAFSATAFAESNGAIALLLGQDYETCKLYFGGLEGTLPLDDVQENQFHMLMGIHLNHLEQATSLEAEGVLSGDLVASAESQITWISTKPGFRSYWRRYGAEHALEVALRELQRRMDAANPEAVEVELAALDRKIERALDLAIEMGEMDAAKERLRSLRVEREAKTRECEQARVSLPTLEELMPRVRAKLEQMESILTEDVARGRLALGALLNGERLRVYADGRIEGNAILPQNELAALGRESSGRQASVVAGARSDRLHMDRPVLRVRLPFDG